MNQKDHVVPRGNQMSTQIPLKMTNHPKAGMARMQVDHGGSCITISCKSSVSTMQTALKAIILRT